MMIYQGPYMLGSIYYSNYFYIEVVKELINYTCLKSLWTCMVCSFAFYMNY
jgi:hypothetical protein